MNLVPKNVLNPVFIRSAAGYDVVDRDEAKRLLKKRKIAKNGQRFGRFTDGVRRWVACVAVYVSRKFKERPQMSSGESARMSPSRPTRGAVWSGTYARNLSGFVAHHDRSVAMFNGWKPKVKVTPIQADASTVKERAILYMPGDGKQPRRGVNVASRPKREIRRNPEGELEILDGGTWVLIAAADASELISAGRAVAVN